jgi:hypothetical protein
MNRNERVLARRGASWLFALVCLLAPATSQAQRLYYEYVGPIDSVRAIFGAVADTGWYDVGYGSQFITPENYDRFNRRAPANLTLTYDTFKPSTTLRKRINQVLRINGGITDVVVALVDDRLGISANSRFADNDLNTGAKFVWPAASAQAGDGGRWIATIGLGVHACDTIQTWPGKWMAWEGTILHEMSHTQFIGPFSRWGIIGTIYGGDGSHSLRELLGDQELTMEEGFGTFWGALHNKDFVDQALIPFFRTADERYFIESRSFLAGTKEMWDAPHLTKSYKTVPKSIDVQTGSYAKRYYKWLDVPGFYLLFNENTSTAFHYFFWKHANGNPDQAASMIRRGAGPMTKSVRKKFLAFAVNCLSLQIEDFAKTSAGAAAKKSGKLSSSMFPFALLDILTHFGMSEEKYKREYTVMYPKRDPKAWTEYWKHRDALQKLTDPMLKSDPIQIEEAIAAAHEFLQREDNILASKP